MDLKTVPFTRGGTLVMKLFPLRDKANNWMVCCPEAITASQRACDIQVQVERQGSVFTSELGKNKLSYYSDIGVYL